MDLDALFLGMSIEFWGIQICNSCFEALNSLMMDPRHLAPIIFSLHRVRNKLIELHTEWNRNITSPQILSSSCYWKRERCLGTFTKLYSLPDLVHSIATTVQIMWTTERDISGLFLAQSFSPRGRLARMSLMCIIVVLGV